MPPNNMVSTKNKVINRIIVLVIFMGTGKVKKVSSEETGAVFVNP